MKFVDPPGGGKQRGRPTKHMTADVLAELDARPGDWALLYEAATSALAGTIRSWCWRHEGYETTCRRTPDKTFDIYVRRIKES